MLFREHLDPELPENQTEEVFVAMCRSKRLLKPEPQVYQALQTAFIVNSTSSMSSSCMPEPVSTGKGETMGERLVFLIHELGLASKYFPVARDAAVVTPSDIHEFPDEAKESAMKELAAWIKLRAGKAIPIAEYFAKTGLKPLPSRWVNTWKKKSGVRRMKRRLVLKGYAERNQQRMDTASPTASRLGHRMVMCKSAEWGLPIVALDISTAFLQGYSFEELNAAGHNRQPCAFLPPEGVFSLLHEMDPKGGWEKAAKEPSLWAFQLDKGAYGLKDAPMLWFLKINHFLKQLEFEPMAHDACVYRHLDSEDQIDALVSLHVDDTLGTGFPRGCLWIDFSRN